MKLCYHYVITIKIHNITIVIVLNYLKMYHKHVIILYIKFIHYHLTLNS